MGSANSVSPPGHGRQFHDFVHQVHRKQGIRPAFTAPVVTGNRQMFAVSAPHAFDPRVAVHDHFFDPAGLDRGQDVRSARDSQSRSQVFAFDLLPKTPLRSSLLRGEQVKYVLVQPFGSLRQIRRFLTGQFSDQSLRKLAVDFTERFLRADQDDAAELVVLFELPQLFDDLLGIAMKLLVSSPLIPLLRPSAFADVVLDLAAKVLFRFHFRRRDQKDPRLLVVRGNHREILVFVL